MVADDFYQQTKQTEQILKSKKMLIVLLSHQKNIRRDENDAPPISPSLAFYMYKVCIS